MNAASRATRTLSPRLSAGLLLLASEAAATPKPHPRAAYLLHVDRTCDQLEDADRASFGSGHGFPVRRSAKATSTSVDLAPGVALHCRVTEGGYGYVMLEVARDAQALSAEASCVVDGREKRVLVDVPAPSACLGRYEPPPVAARPAGGVPTLVLGCALPSAPDGPARIVSGAASVFEARVADGRLQASLDAAGSGYLALPDRAPVPISWSAPLAGIVGCVPAEIAPADATTWVVGALTRAAPGAEVAGCGGWSAVDPEGGFRVAAAPSPCTLYARSPSDPAWRVLAAVSPAFGETVELGTLTAPPPAGPLFVASLTGVLTVAYDHAGLRAGDVVVEVNGEPVGAGGHVTAEAARWDCPGIAQFVVARAGELVQVSTSCGIVD